MTMTPDPNVIAKCLCEALAWGMTYGPVIPPHQWEEMRDAQIKQHMATILGKSKPPESNALDRGMQLLSLRRDQLPRLALAYMTDLSRRVGGCIEVYLTAFTTYAHLTEGKSVDGVDGLYHPTESEVAVYRRIEADLAKAEQKPTPTRAPLDDRILGTEPVNGELFG